MNARYLKTLVAVLCVLSFYVKAANAQAPVSKPQIIQPQTQTTTSQQSDNCDVCSHQEEEVFCSHCGPTIYLNDEGVCRFGYCRRHHPSRRGLIGTPLPLRPPCTKPDPPIIICPGDTPPTPPCPIPPPTTIPPKYPRPPVIEPALPVAIDININEDYFQKEVEQQDLLASPKPGQKAPDQLTGIWEFTTWDEVHPKPQPRDQGVAPIPDRDRIDRTRPAGEKKPDKGTRVGRIKQGSGRGSNIQKPSSRNSRFKPAPRNGNRTYQKGLRTRPGSKQASRRKIRAPKRSARRFYRRSSSRSKSRRG